MSERKGSGVLAVVSTAATYDTTAAETDLFNIPLPTWLLPGDIAIIRASGTQLNNSGGNVTHTPKLYLGATGIFVPNTLALAASANPRNWKLAGWLTVLDESQHCHGEWVTGPASSQAQPFVTAPGGVSEGDKTATETLSRTKNLRLTMTMGSSASTISTTFTIATVTLLRP